MIMDKTKLIERLEIKLKTYTNEFEVLQNDSQIRNIAFGSAGYLSKGSKNKLYKQLIRFFVKCFMVSLINFSIYSFL